MCRKYHLREKKYDGESESMLAFHLYFFSLTGPTSRLFSGMLEFSELVLVRIPLFMNPGRSVLPLRLAKEYEFGEL